jgi:membrane-associated phospholipid phosphatase
MSGRWLFGFTGAALFITLVSCSRQSTDPTSLAASDARVVQAGLRLDVTPASVGWQERARALVAANGLSPLAAGRVYAALSIAQYRAVTRTTSAASDGQLPEFGVGIGGRRALEAQRGAVAGASANVLAFFFPAAVASLEQRVVEEAGEMPGGLHPQFTRGLAIGRAAGDAVVEACRGDGFTRPWTGTVPTGPGMWIANGPPAGATFGGVKPWLLTSGDQFRPPPPPAWQSAAFLADLAEIRTLSDSRTTAQLDNAVYWNFPTGTYTPLGYFNVVAVDYISAYGLDERAATRAMAVMHAAMLDALIGCWDAKYYYWTIRPYQVDAAITLPIGAPNHPSYPSGHSCQSAAAATVLTALFPERAAELDGWVNEAGLSRMYGGIHYRFDITAGAMLGRSVGLWALAHADRLD